MEKKIYLYFFIIFFWARISAQDSKTFLHYNLGVATNATDIQWDKKFNGYNLNFGIEHYWQKRLSFGCYLSTQYLGGNYFSRPLNITDNFYPYFIIKSDEQFPFPFMSKKDSALLYQSIKYSNENSYAKNNKITICPNISFELLKLKRFSLKIGVLAAVTYQSFHAYNDDIEAFLVLEDQNPIYARLLIPSESRSIILEYGTQISAMYIFKNDFKIGINSQYIENNTLIPSTLTYNITFNTPIKNAKN